MPAASIQTAFPLTPLQEGMLYHTLREPDAGVYHAQCTAILEGELQHEPFRQAWRLAVDRHPALRTFLSWDRRERPLQVVRAEVEPDIAVLDWRGIQPGELEERWRALLADDRRRGFDLTTAPLMRLAVVRTSERTHRLLWSIHHAVADGWSGHLVLHEVMRDYGGLVAGRRPELRSAPSFDRFVGWLQRQDAGAAEAFWREALGDVSATTPLPGGARASRAGSPRSEASAVLSAAETSRLKATAATMRVTLNTLLVGAWSAMLASHAGSDDVVFGVTGSERPAEIPGVDGAVGLYLGTVPVRVRVLPDQPIGDWLRGLQSMLSEARAHGSPGLAAIQKCTSLYPGAPLFESLVVFESFPTLSLAGEASAGDPLVMRSAAFEVPNDVPLVVMALPGECLTLTVAYDATAISGPLAERLVNGLAARLGASWGTPTGTVADLFALPAAERATVIGAWSVSPRATPEPEDVVARFEAHAGERGTAVALRTEHAAVTYAELDRRANRIANGLLSSGAGDGATIGILADRSVDAIAAMLGVLKAGAAYAPLDPSAPRARLEALCAGLDALIDCAPSPAGGGIAATGPVWRPDDFSALPERRPALAIPTASAAYVIHTSGSTGEPKGVVVERGALAASTAARDVYYQAPPRSFLLLSPFAVDSSVAGIYWTLCTGGTLVLPAARAEQDAGELAGLVERHGVTHTLMVPSLYRTLLEDADARRLAVLQCAILAGEAVPADLVRRHHTCLPATELHNEYGPSEGTVWATAGLLGPDPGAPVTIGRPVPGARVYLLDAALRPVPAGAPGEICIGGAFVARGYRGLPDETQRRFCADPFVPGGRLYRTGDLGRFLDDGRIEFLGRSDEQIKVRGFRVEPEEIERALASYDGVREAAVVLQSPLTTDIDLLTDALLGRPDADIDRLLAVAEVAR